MASDSGAISHNAPNAPSAASINVMPSQTIRCRRHRVSRAPIAAPQARPPMNVASMALNA